MKKPVYRNEINECQVTADLELTQRGLQAVVDAWTVLDIGPVVDLTSLVMNCEEAYTRAVNKDVEVPVFPGRYQISKDIWLKTITIPVPNLLYVKCRDVRRLNYWREADLWRTENGKVLLVDEVAVKHIHSETIFADDPVKVKLICDLKSVTDLLNSLNDQLAGELFDEVSPISNRFFHSKWRFLQRHIVLEGDFIRRCCLGINKYGDGTSENRNRF